MLPQAALLHNGVYLTRGNSSELRADCHLLESKVAAPPTRKMQLVICMDLLVPGYIWEVMFSLLTMRHRVLGMVCSMYLARSTQQMEAEQPMPDMLYVRQSVLILKRFTICMKFAMASGTNHASSFQCMPKTCPR